MANIVQNKDKAYGYNYSSLAALAAAGVEIPKMRTATVEGKQFVEYLDEAGEWQRGAEIVVPEMKGMNAAQAYGSALTYARRYTVMMAKSVVCTDDQLLETQAPQGNIETPERAAPRRETRKAPAPGRDTAPAPKPAETPTEAATGSETADPMICEDCGKPIEPFERFGVMDIATRSYSSYGKYLCWNCAGKAKRTKEKANA